MAEADDCKRALDGDVVPPFPGTSLEPCVSLQNHECGNFYANRCEVFWIDPSMHIYFGQFGYTESPPPQKNVNTCILHSTAMNLVQYSTRNVLYNLMFLSQLRLLDLSRYVLAMIYTNIPTEDYDKDGWEKMDDLDRYHLMSVYNCIHLVLRENMGICVDDKDKKKRSNVIASKIDKYGLCPCEPAKHVSTYKYEEYTCHLRELPDDFYRNPILKHQTKLPLA